MKKKALLFGVSVLAAFGLASCGEEAEQSVNNNPNPVDTGDDNPTGEDTKTYLRHKAIEPTYTSRGQIEYYTTSEDSNYYDADHKLIEDKNSIYLPAKAFVSKIVSIEDNGAIVVEATCESFKKAYNGKYTLDVAIGTKTYSAPTAKWAEEVEEGNAVITAEDVVRVEILGGNLQEATNASVGDEVSFRFVKKGYDTRIRVFNYLNSKTAVQLYGKDFEITYDESVEEDVLNLINDIKDKVAEGTVTEEHPDTSNAVAYDVIDGLYQEFIDYYYDLVDQYRYCAIVADSTAAAEDIDRRNAVLKFVESLEVYDQEIDIAVAKSIYRNQYFEDMTDEEIDDYIAGLNPEETAQAKEYSAAMEDAIALYEKDDSKAYQALSTYVTNATEYAKLQGYADYISYAYENVYDREYLYTDTNSLETYISEYIVPIYDYTSTKFEDFMENRDKYTNVWNNFVGVLYNFYGNYFDQLEDYAALVGGDYQKNFKQYFVDGNYFYSSLDNKNVTGYVGTYADGSPLMFLSANYQGVNTFIHEFGHYNAKCTGGDFGSYDLAETQSQGNEMLFYTYFAQQNVIMDTVMDQFFNYQIYNMANSIILGYLINELEKYVYTNPTFTEAQFSKQWSQICTDAGLSSFTSSMDPYGILLNYQCYYISYSTSAIASLELYAACLKDYDAAIDSYTIIYQKHTEDATFSSILEDAGLYNVFSEDAYKLIASAFPNAYEQE